MTLTPDEVVAIDDPGDETLRRYRYQWTCAATMCCSILDDSLDTKEVFCEHHEDILVKHADDTYSGLQIKTRAADQPVWKTSDEAVKGACSRFTKLENQFPDLFRNFSFLTNHPLHSAKNGKDLRFVLGQLRSSEKIEDVTGPTLTFLKGVAKDAACDVKVAYKALCKTECSDELPKLKDVQLRLAKTLTSVWSEAEDMSISQLDSAVGRLEEECCKASSLSHLDILPGYLPAVCDSKEIELRKCVKTKRFDKTRLLNLLEGSRVTTSVLAGDPLKYTKPGSGNTDLLLQKLDAGGFSAVSCHAASDLRAKSDYLGMTWIKKYGHERGLKQYDHIRSLVLCDSASAFEEVKNEDMKFGTKMLSELRRKIKERRIEGSQLYDCSDEHLEGFAYSLSAQCKVQWSIDRPWEDD